MTFRSKYGQPFFALIAVLLFFSPIVAFGDIGVGVGLGKIQIDEPLKAGGIYDLPSLPVINTGDEPGQYGVSVEYQENVPQMWPAREWFHFDPQSFSLEPGKSQTAKVTLTLPLQAKPGNYFAYLEGHPIKKSVAGITTIGVAAAAKLYFTVAPANIFQGMYYRFMSLYSIYYPWDMIIPAIIFVAVLLRIIGKRFKFSVAKK